MEFDKVISERHSVRSFENKKVPKTILKSLVKDATKAPSAGNGQPWNFYVVCSKEIRDELSKIMNKSFYKYIKDFEKLSPKLQKIGKEFYADLGNAQNIIFVYMPKGTKSNSIIASVSCACENLMLSATNKGLGTCWIGSFKGFEKEINKLLNIPENEELLASILIGYPSKDFKRLKRTKKKLSDVLTFI